MGDGRDFGNQKWEYESVQMPHYYFQDGVRNDDTVWKVRELENLGKLGFELAGMSVVDGIFTLVFKRPYTDGTPVPESKGF